MLFTEMLLILTDIPYLMSRNTKILLMISVVYVHFKGSTTRSIKECQIISYRLSRINIRDDPR